MLYKCIPSLKNIYICICHSSLHCLKISKFNSSFLLSIGKQRRQSPANSFSFVGFSIFETMSLMYMYKEKMASRPCFEGLLMIWVKEQIGFHCFQLFDFDLIDKLRFTSRRYSTSPSLRVSLLMFCRLYGQMPSRSRCRWHPSAVCCLQSKKNRETFLQVVSRSTDQF